MRRKYSLRPLLPKYWFQISRKSQPQPLTQWFIGLETQQRFSQTQILGPHSAGLEGDVPNVSPGTCIFKLLVRWWRGNWANMEGPCSWGYVLTSTLWVLGTPEKWQCHRSCRWGLEGLRRKWSHPVHEEWHGGKNLHLLTPGQSCVPYPRMTPSGRTALLTRITPCKDRQRTLMTSVGSEDVGSGPDSEPPPTDRSRESHFTSLHFNFLVCRIRTSGLHTTVIWVNEKIHGKCSVRL